MASAESRQAIEQVHTLLQQYFEVGNCEIDRVIAGWLQSMEIAWIHAAIMEALYQGRYKLVSVDQILRLWQRRGNPLRHFNREFESIISGHSTLFPNTLAAAESTLLRSAAHPQSFYRPAPVVPSGNLATGSPTPPPLPDPQPSAIPLPPQAAVLRPAIPQPTPLEVPAVTMLPPEPVAQEDVQGEAQENEVPAGLADELPGELGREMIPEPLGGVIDIFDSAAFGPDDQDLLDQGNTLIPDAHPPHHPDPIQPFIPEAETSELYHRLQEVARRSAALS